MKFDILTLFPGMFEGPFSESIIRRAVDSGLIRIRLHNIRDYAVDRHKTVDDAPYGGGAGMVMKVEPIAACLEAVRSEAPASRVVLTSPAGKPLDQQLAGQLAAEEGIIIICGRYEGVDQRVIDLFSDYEISLGDFVLTGGEIPAMALVDAVSRLVPGVLGSSESASGDSFCDGLLEYPQFTRPPEFQGQKVPEVLLSGNHAEIVRWRRNQSLMRTRKIRPELLKAARLSAEERRFLDEAEEVL
ncbi:tRNA (guanosine(37)-N1)-methyltransferase TrmD [Geobacter sp. DSM 9736]|uniref:tRNA (guanosine(37)-N1)-methyltransferase TrmD n=1 Tax=Geobacter sp. DSM 9736 TaxID=1277350 RepID=UPI000B51494E|nr:tRNA (guanosine(37)-N1)-methyltransferase TrmD [Geobacter sp. DSM 9736]SNB46365.1 tRNA (Guanine37-N(1)-) methyltransferase [Geobacter sp. DSM 9736]